MTVVMTIDLQLDPKCHTQKCVLREWAKTGLLENISNKKCPVGSDDQFGRHIHNGEPLYRLKSRVMPQRCREFVAVGVRSEHIKL